MKINLSKISQIAFFVLILPILSILLVFCLNYVARPFFQQWFFPLIDSLGFLGAYSLLFSQFNSWGWKGSIFKKFGVVAFPNLNGRWKGNIVSSYDKRKAYTPAYLEIRQTFLEIHVDMYTEESKSNSLMADFTFSKGGRKELHYEYFNEPNEKAKKTMHAHNGTVKLVFLEDKNILSGSYYNTNQHRRGHIGSLIFRFESINLLGRFED